ncbi:MAG: restriction endonuclease [Bacteriovoracaceae bacterium]
MSKRRFKIYKAHGGLEDFSKDKLYKSLKRSGLSHKQSEIISNKVSKEVTEGTKTRDIYRKTLKLVNQSSKVAAVQYSLKRALFELGPSGHHFETFVAKYFQEIGYKTKTCQIVSGKFVKHEIDVVANKENKRVFVECKFHNRVGIKNDIKIALYVKARWDDLKEGPEGKNLDKFYLATNTAFTLDALTYAQGTGLNLLGVNAPSQKSFLEQIKEMGLYPVTSLKHLNRYMKNELLMRDIVLVKEIPDQVNLLYTLGMKDYEVKNLLEEINQLKVNQT